VTFQLAIVWVLSVRSLILPSQTLVANVCSTVLERLVSTGYLGDHQDISVPNLPPNVEDALARRQAEVAILGEMSSWPGPASSHAPRLPRASVDHPPPEVAIPPAFVGDEEILPRRIRPPRVI
jgi:hypothetical protein